MCEDFNARCFVGLTVQPEGGTFLSPEQRNTLEILLFSRDPPNLQNYQTPNCFVPECINKEKLLLALPSTL